jgi:hypothetical protein
MAEKKLSDFSEDFFLAWDLAKEQRLVLQFDTKNQATNFRHRLYSFRTKLRKESAPLPTPYDGIELSITQEGEVWEVSTKTSRWREQIRQLASLNKEPNS